METLIKIIELYIPAKIQDEKAYKMEDALF